MELVKYLSARICKYMGYIVCIMSPFIVGMFISTKIIQDASFSILIIPIAYVVSFFIQHFIEAWHYMKAHNVSPEEAWKKTCHDDGSDEFDF